MRSAKAPTISAGVMMAKAENLRPLGLLFW